MYKGSIKHFAGPGCRMFLAMLTLPAPCATGSIDAGAMPVLGRALLTKLLSFSALIALAYCSGNVSSSAPALLRLSVRNLERT
ncbi:hypothetical protein HJA87_15340 [Rhizobium bangladeshense]|uniref:Uncharacterized protein n=1 Tax=Rhizobium bangladeshense TaxID=1138189 RepID=A0ABS7LID8_9HYPH|nr:hypothetical protein [Rhizobium bangladeshense]MBX4867167.1 hypothetical protein [Rhizobium bangladeshense]MBX4871458.1 hypothetical protein [Rhizobium bangladeshense]MBX4882772.1 hypothetical protein [Rhizobium bangladeshense]MBX4891162.1 hypothetical protein [Rhizobium bangladeshense]MBY3591246.1 hypothetical protein [Rhizobium bangladeshense]